MMRVVVVFPLYRMVHLRSWTRRQEWGKESERWKKVKKVEASK